MGCLYFDEMMRSFSALPGVDAILLAGSRAANTDDALSDYDVYIYANTEISLETREMITAKYCSYMELNNQFWETEDDGVLKDGTDIELIYRDLNWLDKELQRVLYQYQASTGYSTCFWANLLNSRIIYDRNGNAQQLIEKFTLNYPPELQANIINKNYPLLKLQMPAYRHQIHKAMKRNDLISVNHRVAEFLASYFDILFAINELPHPGEKRLIEIAKAKCDKLPGSFEHNITNLLMLAGQQNDSILEVIDQLVEGLTLLLEKEGLLSISGLTNKDYMAVS